MALLIRAPEGLQPFRSTRCSAHTMPSADFSCEIKAPCDALSHESATHSRSPKVSSTAFRTQPPDLQPVPLLNNDFAVTCPLVRQRMPQIRFLYIGSYVCSTLLSDPPSPERPCASAATSRPSGLYRGLSPPSRRTCSAHKKKAGRIF